MSNPQQSDDAMQHGTTVPKSLHTQQRAAYPEGTNRRLDGEGERPIREDGRDDRGSNKAPIGDSIEAVNAAQDVWAAMAQFRLIPCLIQEFRRLDFPQKRTVGQGHLASNLYLVHIPQCQLQRENICRNLGE